MKFSYVNIGNNIAKNTIWALKDSLTKELFLRRFLKQKTIKNPIYTPAQSYFTFNSIDPSYTSENLLKIEIGQIDSNQNFQTHYVIFYENDMGHLFDSYYQSLIKFEGFLFEIEYNKTDTSFLGFTIIDSIRFSIDENYSDFKVYSMKESEEMKRKLTNLITEIQN